TMVGPGSYTIHLTANDGSSNNGGAGNTTTKDVTFTVKDTTPPTINCPANITTNTDPGLCSAVVVVGAATASDNCDALVVPTGTRSDNQPLIALYPKGTTTITWTATDASGNQSSCTQTVTVVDNEPPTITFNGNIPSMWPPNHVYHTFTAADFISSVSDNCDTLSVSDVYITAATSDEAENAAGSGNTLNDIVISGDCKSVQLRAERINSGNGRVYTIYFKLKDSSGNSTTGTAKVYSPKNQGETPGDDGPHYTVTSSCP
ncbi:MAG TPA: HYR domain-containing protein, partial [Pyrinomonadaceae bacterium]